MNDLDHTLQASHNRRRRCLLHIEDDEDYAFLIRHLLHNDAYSDSSWHAPQIVHFDNVTDGVAWLNSHARPDAAILDMNLPDYQGLDTYLAVQTAAPDLPVLIISAEHKIDLATDCLEHGAGGYIPKDQLSAEQIFVELEGAWMRHTLAHDAAIHNQVLEDLHTGVLILRHDLDGWKFHYANRMQEQWFGSYPERGTPVEQLADRLDDADKQKFLRALQRAIHKGRATMTLSFLPPRSRQKRWYDFSFEKIEVQRFEYLVLRVHDNTRVRLKEQAARINAAQLQTILAQSEQRERALIRAAEEWRYTFDGVEEIIIVIGHDGKILRLNQRARTLISKDYEELIFHSWNDILFCLPFDDNGLVRRCLDTQKVGEAIVMDPQAGRWFKLRVSALEDDQNEFFGVVLFGHDITADRRLADISQLQAWNETMGQLSAGVAHELRNITFAIDTSMYALDKQLPQKGEWRKYLDIVALNVDRIHESVNKLVEFQTIGEKLEPAPLYIRDLVNEAVGAAIDETISHKWKIACDGKLKVYVDHNYVVQLLLEIMANSLQLDPCNNLEISVQTRGREFVAVKVLDEGEGFDEDALLRGFEPFFTTRTGRSGLGLSRVKLIVTLHGGSCDFGNRDTGGAWFECTLPRTRAAFRRHSSASRS